MLVIGGCHRDILARTSAVFEPGTSCPGMIAERDGGVAHNVAILLASAGIPLRFVTRVGADGAGASLKDDLNRRGIDTSHIVSDPDAATGRYIAIHDADGELAAAVSDLGIYDRLTLADVPQTDAGLVFADANLSAELLTALGQRFGSRLVVDALSRAKSPRLMGLLGSGALILSNRWSAEALVGRELPTADDAASALSALGHQRAVISDGGRSLAQMDGSVREIITPPPRKVRDVTGAGDALIAGILIGLNRRSSLADAVRIGIETAGAALETTGALPALPRDLLIRLGLT